MVIAYPPNNSDYCDLLKPDIAKAEGQIQTRTGQNFRTYRTQKN
jgi:hypothetical protein